jgi:hypothetical protein
MLFFDTSMLFWHVDAVLKRQCFSQHVNEFSTCQYFSWYTNAFLNISKLFLTYQCFSQHVDTCQFDGVRTKTVKFWFALLALIVLRKKNWKLKTVSFWSKILVSAG